MTGDVRRVEAYRLRFWTHFVAAVPVAFHTERAGRTLERIYVLNAWVMATSPSCPPLREHHHGSRSTLGPPPVISKGMDPRTPDLETLQFQREQLTTAVQALTSLTRTPQERLDRALSYFTRTFRDDPSGQAFALWRRIYKAIGDPPLGTTVAVKLDLLSPEECETISQALCELAGEIQKTCWEAERTAALAADGAPPSA